MTRGKLYEFSPSFLHIYCWYTSNHTLFPSTATNAAQSERRVIQFPLCIIVIIGRYQNASQACYKSSHYFILKNSSISIWTSKQGCIHGGLSQAHVGNGGNNWHVLSFSQFNTSFQLTCALMGYSFIFSLHQILLVSSQRPSAGPPLMAETDSGLFEVPLTC